MIWVGWEVTITIRTFKQAEIEAALRGVVESWEWLAPRPEISPDTWVTGWLAQDGFNYSTRYFKLHHNESRELVRAVREDLLYELNYRKLGAPHVQPHWNSTVFQERIEASFRTGNSYLTGLLKAPKWVLTSRGEEMDWDFGGDYGRA